MAFAAIPDVKRVCKDIVGQACRPQQQTIAEKYSKPFLTGRKSPDRDCDICAYDHMAFAINRVKAFSNIFEVYTEPCKRIWLKIDIAKSDPSSFDSSQQAGFLSAYPVIADGTPGIVVNGERRRLIDWLGHRRSFGGSQLSKKLLSFLDRDGCFSLRSAFASIWRMRSRVTENCWPTSSSV